MMATIANAQVGKEFQGNYSFESDINLLINKWSKKSNLDSNQTITSTQTITIKTGVSKDEFKSPEEIEKMVNDTINKMVTEAMAKHGARGEIVSSTRYSKSMVIYDDIIVKVTSTAICGSDLHLVHGLVKGMYDGFVLGHETMGIVEEIGKGVTKLKKGGKKW